MSEIEEKAAKFEVIERYQRAKNTLGTIETRLRTLGGSLKGLGMELESAGRPSGVLHKVDLRDLAALLDSHAEALQALARSRADMEKIGIQAF